jgi:hypothetical protein
MLKSFAQALVISPEAVSKFGPEIDFTTNATSITSWLEQKGINYNYIKKPWIPSENETDYIVYQSSFQTYYFGPYQDTKAYKDDLLTLKILKANILDKDPAIEHLEVTPIRFQSGKEVKWEAFVVFKGSPLLMASKEDIEETKKSMEEKFKELSNDF